MQQYSLTPNQARTLTTTYFYLPQLKYYSTLDYIPIKEINSKLNSIKNRLTITTVKVWLNSVSIYLDILSLIGLSHQIVYSSEVYQLISGSSLITDREVTKEESISLIKDYLLVAEPVSLASSFLLEYSKSFLEVSDKNLAIFFKSVNNLSYLEKEYFYKMFYYLQLTDLDLFNYSSKSNSRFLAKCINTWNTLWTSVNILELKKYLSIILPFDCNNKLIDCIGNPSLINLYNTPKESKYKCEDILGISLNTDPTVAKHHYLKLIKENHPDKHMIDFEYYSHKTAELNLAWNEWRMYKNEL